MMAKLTDKLPEGEQWTYEVKWDGYRALLLKSVDAVRLLSRKDNDLTSTYPAIASAAQKLRAKTAILDGEIAALNERGVPSFELLQRRINVSDASSVATLPMLSSRVPLGIFTRDVEELITRAKA